MLHVRADGRISKRGQEPYYKLNIVDLSDTIVVIKLTNFVSCTTIIKMHLNAVKYLQDDPITSL